MEPVALSLLKRRVSLFFGGNFMNVVYPVIFTETRDGTVLAYIPDLDGATEGCGIADALSMARDFIGNALCTKEERNFPEPTKLSAVDVSKSEFAGDGFSFVSPVDVNLDAFRRAEKSRKVRRNITLPEWLDEMASMAKINVSAVTQEALCSRLGVV